MKEIYFDHSAATPVDPSVVEAMMPYLKKRTATPPAVTGWARKRAGAWRMRGSRWRPHWCPPR